MNRIGVAAALKRWREVRGLSQRALADKSGVGYASIARIETGRQNPTLGMLARLAKALNATVADLIGEGKPARKRARRR
ncbi:MAG: helix-turn-helix transcriptional regulator [candidate division NC10 bacterium]|nr:helix-turn-helix transcriptional regulator [candidate division NC10 bacterium]